MSEFKDMIAYLRKRENLSQRELAAKLNVSASTIGMYESGQRYPSREQEEAIADFFNVNLDTLRGKVPTETNKENADAIVELMQDARMFSYIKKLNELSQKDKEAIYKFIEFVSDQNGQQ